MEAEARARAGVERWLNGASLALLALGGAALPLPAMATPPPDVGPQGAAVPIPFVAPPTRTDIPSDAPAALAGCPLAGSPGGERAIVVVEVPSTVPSFTVWREGPAGFELSCRRRCCANVFHGKLVVELAASAEWLGGQRVVNVDRSMRVRLTPRRASTRTLLLGLGLGGVGASVGLFAWGASQRDPGQVEGSPAGAWIGVLGLTALGWSVTSLFFSQRGPQVSVQPLRGSGALPRP